MVPAALLVFLACPWLARGGAAKPGPRSKAAAAAAARLEQMRVGRARAFERVRAEPPSAKMAEVIESIAVSFELPAALENEHLASLEGCAQSTMSLDRFRLGAAVALESQKGNASSLHVHLQRLPTLREFREFLPRFMGPSLQDSFATLPVVRRVRAQQAEDARARACFESWRRMPRSPVSGVRWEEMQLGLARLDSLTFSVGRPRIVGLSGFQRSGLNTVYEERSSPKYLIHGRQTYWSENGKYFAYWCPQHNQWRVSQGMDHLRSVQAGTCYGWASAPAGVDIFEAYMSVGWHEFTDSGWVKRVNAGVISSRRYREVAVAVGGCDERKLECVANIGADSSLGADGGAASNRPVETYCYPCGLDGTLKGQGFLFQGAPLLLEKIEDPESVDCFARGVFHEAAPWRKPMTLREATEGVLELGDGTDVGLRFWTTPPPCRQSLLDSAEEQGQLWCSLARLAWQYCGWEWQMEDQRRLEQQKPHTTTWAELTTWMRDNGAKVDERLELRSDGHMRGVYAGDVVPSNTTVMEIPHALVFSLDYFPEIQNVPLEEYEGCYEGLTDFESLKHGVAIALETRKGSGSFYHPYLRGLPTLREYRTYLPDFIGPDLASDFAALPVFYSRKREKGCFDSWRQEPDSLVMGLRWEEVRLALARLDTRGFRAGNRRNFTLTGFSRSALNVDYVERTGEAYRVGGRETYWSRTGGYFVYLCSQKNEWRVSQGMEYLRLIRAGVCYAWAASPAESDVLDPSLSGGWSELMADGWVLRPGAGIARLGETTRRIAIPGMDLVNTDAGHKVNTDWSWNDRAVSLRSSAAAGDQLHESYCFPCDNSVLVNSWGVYFGENQFALEDPEAVDCAASVDSGSAGSPGVTSLREVTEAALEIGHDQGRDMHAARWASNAGDDQQPKVLAQWLETPPQCRRSVSELVEGQAQGPLRCSLARLAWEYCAWRWRQADVEKLDSNRPQSIFGQAYVQSGMLGFASYHFVSEVEAYISYESHHFADYTLDDGSKLPARKSFERISYDPAVRTFVGTISWAPAAWAGWERWEFEVIFSEDFTRISGGQIRLFGPGAEPDAPPLSTMRFGVDIPFRGRWVPQPADVKEHFV